MLCERPLRVIAYCRVVYSRQPLIGDWCVPSRLLAAGPWATAFALGVAAAAVILVFWAQWVWLLLFLGLLLGVLLDTIAEFGMRHARLPRGVAVILAALIFFIGLGGIIMLIATPLLQQGTEMMHSLPQETARFSRTLEHYRNEYPFLKRVLPESQQVPTKQTGPETVQVAKKALVTVSTALDWIARLLGTFFFGLFLAWDPERWMRGVAELWPQQLVDARIELFRCIAAALRSYLFTVGISMVVMAVLWTLGLWIIGIKFALLFGAIGGLVEIVPYAGPLLGLLPPLLYALATDGTKALYVLLLYTVLHIIEGYILVPYVLHERERFPPPLVVLSILLAGTLFGVLGVLLAVPLGTTVYVWLQETVYKRTPTKAS